MQELSQDILKELELRGASPKPRWHFLFMRALLWLLVAVSIVVGGIAISVGWYVFFDNDGLHVTLANLFQVIPYVWLFVFAVFVMLAYLGFRKTRKGYRYPAVWVVSATFAGSVLLGLVLDRFDLGQSIHKYLLAHTNFYDALIYSSEDKPD